MQVYVNAFEIHGERAEEVCFRAIHGWLSQQIDADFSLADLKVPNHWQGKRFGKSAWLRTYICLEDERALYAWRLKHADDTVPGRQWTVEIGLVCMADRSQFSVSIQTDEQSTEVTERVSPSRPRLIGYLLSNVQNDSAVEIDPSTPGRHIKRIGESEYDYRGILSEIQNSNRDFPLVLVSPDREGKYLINRQWLQDQLFGLAQVVEVVEGFDSYEMENILGRYWSAWDGAVNVIRTRHPSGRIFGNPILSEQILEQGESQRERIAHLLGKVTHNTNIPRLRMQIKPEAVLHRATRIHFQSRLAELREESGDAGAAQIDELLDDLVKFEDEQKRLGEEKEQLEMSLMQANEEIQALDHEIRQLKYLARHSQQVGADGQGQGNPEGVAPNQVALALIAEGAEPSPVEALELIASGYPGKVAVLASALESAEEVTDFQQGRRLFDMLRRLVTDYRDKIKAGGDAAARTVFTPNEYAARESETVLNSARHLAYREFPYKGEKWKMLRHLKIGVADDLRKTIRVYFEWDSEAEKIVIAHCGKHLPIPSH